eukprot:CAMPEP_0184355048 /NCGR_PEP_ID=MMETSP1089-20130417/92944_1 /TAXON_ID=38269 ORGANISM="Gloeochaete wittrockiana, Strain SAG46.84" /NCGR_SAMPLE_ID=MMETSP1089 /ASSEMBLY_ACC=CAM_ASM_000445 /LENGTH=109 /DNA_ID=CAMNT_0026691451 /DNA_START=13 /DNA_END=339 /DNA_ORIENTATION=+
MAMTEKKILYSVQKVVESTSATTALRISGFKRINNVTNETESMNKIEGRMIQNEDDLKQQIDQFFFSEKDNRPRTALKNQLADKVEQLLEISSHVNDFRFYSASALIIF